MITRLWNSWVRAHVGPDMRTSLLLLVPAMLLPVALLTACGPGDDPETTSDPAPEEPVTSSTGPGSEPGSEPEVEVTGTSSGPGQRALESSGGASATWVPEDSRLVYVTELGYSGCAPTARLASEQGVLRLVVTPYAGPDMCTMQATHYAVLVDGLDDAPARLEVTGLSGTSEVEVQRG